MLDARLLREKLDLVKEKMRQRGADIDFNQFDDLDNRRRSILSQSETLRHRRNVVSDEIAELKKAKQKADDLILEMREVSQKIKDQEKDLAEIEEQLSTRSCSPYPISRTTPSPSGKVKTTTRVYRVWGEKPVFDFEPQAHWDTRCQPGHPRLRSRRQN